ncbi:Nitrate/nitrite transporter (plasmid) [Paraburkholderia caribensis MBA4]|uniref:Nitrate/nitrite transporter n=1 Tax=Paraburkholderia caribensis MBA4 TaxID=1323664 RepID=A0A0P0RQM3_9BURK|nr:MFS transporter [Paraburkholderia caribensis]ALL71314.1 Nitrate/nitrite transporter [Paraburkholderia caribensis MBA4]
MKIFDDAPVRKAFWRLMPLLVLCYFVAYLDRANVGFAAVHMSHDIGLTASAFGFGAGLFFLTYFLLEVPSNLLLARYGARRWIARIMFTWGAMSGAMAFVTNETGFYTLRLLLGAAEAGFFPGITYFVTLWFPAAYRARIMAFFLCAAPISLSIGGPVSGALLGLDGFLGVPGWRWMFIIEALPAMILSIVVLRYLTDRPSDAGWLASDERIELSNRLATDAQQSSAAGEQGLFHALFNSRVLLFGLANFAIVVAAYGVSFFLPRIIKEFGLSDLQTGFLSAVPYALAAIVLVWWGKRSDARLERRYHTVIPIVFASVGLAAAALLTDPVARTIAFSCAAIGCWAAMPVFWSLCFGNIPRKNAAGAIAVINAIANLGGFTGPSIMGFFRDRTGDFVVGLLVLAGVNLVAAGIVVLVGRKPTTPELHERAMHV